MRLARAALALFAASCASPQPIPQPAGASSAAEKPAQPYSGHGAASVSKETLERFAPKPLPDALTRAIQTMLDVRAPAPGRLSPDGAALYFGWRVTGVGQLWRLDGPMRFPAQLTGGQDQTGLADIAPDGSALVIQRDRKGEENPGLYLMSPSGGPLQLIQHKPGIQTSFQFVSDDSRYVYFRSNDKKPDAYALYRYDRAEKRIEEVFAQEGLWFIADHKPGKLLLAKEVGSNMTEIFELDESAKQLSPLFGQGEREEYDAGYGPGDEILVDTPHFGEYRRLYSWSNGKFTPITPELKYDVSGWTIDRPGRQRVLYEINEGGYTRLRAMDARSHAELPLPALPAADHVLAGATTPDGRYTVLAVDAGTEPLQSFVLDWKTGKLTRWHQGSAPEVDLSSFVRARLETYPARDGTPIPVLVREPKRCERPCPVVINFHGGPEAQAQPGFSTSAQLFLDAGFVYLQPNVRGSDGYGKTWIHADDGPKRLSIITDIEDAAAWARKRFSQGGTPKVGIYGGSYGGYSSLVGMTMFAGAYDAGVEIVGISNLVTFLLNTAPYRRALRVSEYGDPEKDREALLKLSPITYIDRVKGPMLLIQGASDPRVPVGEAVQIHDAFQSRQLPVELVIFPDEGHGAQKRDNLVYQTGYTLRFFQRYLQGKQIE